MPGVRGVTAVGHSMGNIDVLRLLRAGAPLDAAVMMGASLPHRNAPPGYEERRFLAEQRIAAPVAVGRSDGLRNRYYDAGRYAPELPPSHPPIDFVNFGIEWGDIEATRDELYGMLPGPKTRSQLADTTHHLNAKDCCGLMVGDTRATRRHAAKLRELARGAQRAGSSVAAALPSPDGPPR